MEKEEKIIRLHKAKQDKIKLVFKHKISIGYAIASTAVILSTVVMISYFLFGAIITGAGYTIYLLSNTGMEIDFQNQKYRNAVFILGFTFGKWKQLPAPEYISVFKTVLAQKVTGRNSFIGVTNSYTAFLVNLIYEKRKRLTIYRSNSYEDAYAKAVFLSEKLKVRIYDATKKHN